MADVTSLRSLELTNAQLIEGLANGCPNAASSFYDRFGAGINRMVWRLLGADPDHEDIVQHVFAQILDCIQTIKSPSSLHDWVTSVTYNTVRQELRYRKYRRLVVPHTDDIENAVDESDTEDMLLVRQLFALLERMKPDNRLLITLRYVEGYTLQEIATVAGYSLTTAKRRFAKARKAFDRAVTADPILSSTFGGTENE